MRAERGLLLATLTAGAWVLTLSSIKKVGPTYPASVRPLPRLLFLASSETQHEAARFLSQSITRRTTFAYRGGVTDRLFVCAEIREVAGLARQ